jgi:phospholipid-binding lipoprotein MlaA
MPLTKSPFSIGKRFRLVGVLAVSLLLSACASTTAGNEEAPGNGDPLEGLNRMVFSINLAADFVIVRPVAELYRTVIPAPGRKAVVAFLRNLESPVVLANDILQGNIPQAGNTTARFLINITLGLAGIFDVAAKMGFPRHSEDFGQTLGVWGMGEGFYLVLPAFGPSSLRDAFGLGVDYYMDPLRYWAKDTDQERLMLARTAVRGIDARARSIETLDEIERSSIDFYATVRSLYRQQRQSEIHNGEVPSLPVLPDFSLDDPDDDETALLSDD